MQSLMQDGRDIERKYKKKAKLLSQHKKELTTQVKNMHTENQQQREYFGQLIIELETKLEEVIANNKSLDIEYQEYKHKQN